MSDSDERPAVDELHRLALDHEPRAVVGDVVERGDHRVEAGLLGEPADEPELRDGRRAGDVEDREARRLREVAVPLARGAVGVQERDDDLGQHGRVAGVEDVADAGEGDLLAAAPRRACRPRHAGRRVRVELEELDVVVVQEGVEPGHADGLREARVDPHEGVLARRQPELLLQQRVVAVRVAEAVEDRGDRRTAPSQPAQLAGRDEVRHEHEGNRPVAVDEALLGEPLGDLGLHHRAAIPELRELDQVLQLEIADVVDHGRLET